MYNCGTFQSGTAIYTGKLLERAHVLVYLCTPMVVQNCFEDPPDAVYHYTINNPFIDSKYVGFSSECLHVVYYWRTMMLNNIGDRPWTASCVKLIVYLISKIVLGRLR